jgi:Gas vesicle synthesis protein GvpL/GvpF
VTDELARWAAARGPALRARAEEEAVAVLRDALVAAALDEPGSAQAAEQRPESREPEPEPEPGELLWAYCVLSADSPHPVHQPGVAPAGTVEPIEAAGLTALVSRVPRAEFGEQPLRRNLNDLTWLERVARAHESVLERTLEESTIVPLRLCTLYESDEGVRDMLAREAPALLGALELLAGREEWSVKVLVDPAKLAEEAHSRSDQAKSLEGELAGRGGGGAYMLRRRLERHVREQADSLARELAGQVHAQFEERSLDAVTRQPQNRELSGHEGDMLLNAAYLVERERVSELQDLATRLEQDHRALGARIELSGPWPPYNFVPAGTAAVP